MKNSSKTVILTVTVALNLSVLTGCTGLNGVPQADADEIKVMIRLDLKEDIGLLLTDYTVNGSEGSGGISNANRTLLRKNSADLDWSYRREMLDRPAGTAEVILKFTVVTEYFDPNYDNDYPEEYMIPMDPISFTADFGKVYYVTITGDKTGGYRAVFNGSK